MPVRSPASSAALPMGIDGTAYTGFGRSEALGSHGWSGQHSAALAQAKSEAYMPSFHDSFRNSLSHIPPTSDPFHGNFNQVEQRRRSPPPHIQAQYPSSMFSLPTAQSVSSNCAAHAHMPAQSAWYQRQCAIALAGASTYPFTATTATAPVKASTIGNTPAPAASPLLSHDQQYIYNTPAMIHANPNPNFSASQQSATMASFAAPARASTGGTGVSAAPSSALVARAIAGAHAQAASLAHAASIAACANTVMLSSPLRPASPAAGVPQAPHHAAVHAQLVEMLAHMQPFGNNGMYPSDHFNADSSNQTTSHVNNDVSVFAAPIPDEQEQDDVHDPIAKEAAAALEAAVNREKAGSGTGGNSQLHRAHSLRNVRGAGVPPPSPASSMAGARRTSARAPGRLRRCESMGDLWKGAGTPASRSIDADKVVRDAASALEEAVAREQAAARIDSRPEQRKQRVYNNNQAMNYYNNNTNSQIIYDNNSCHRLPPQSLKCDQHPVDVPRPTLQHASSHGCLTSRTTISLPHDLLDDSCPELIEYDWGVGGGFEECVNQPARRSVSAKHVAPRLDYSWTPDDQGMGGNAIWGSVGLDAVSGPLTDLSPVALPFVPVALGSCSSSSSGCGSDGAPEAHIPTCFNQGPRGLSHQVDNLLDDEDFSVMLGELSAQSLLLNVHTEEQ
eukprot:CAMPEP_0114253234 /NCGR_PEP_ID=MMETSP0058-20121206/16277_1 /TAXON_ID=36894 /ORGANISM="Pyramimonas parkeae, CCMP726" /LENGTH=674 /DNA_ID=CAMNT_0001367253 /DNA_START=243 /DNA_END=2267 /DNA_ORIENTATION=+